MRTSPNDADDERSFDQPFVVAPYDPDLHCAPLTLFAQLRAGRPPLILDLRPTPAPLALRGAVAWSAAARAGDPWPFGRVEAVVLDDDGSQATATVAALRAHGHRHVRALYGGLRLYAFTLQPAVVAAPRFVFRPGLFEENGLPSEP